MPLGRSWSRAQGFYQRNSARLLHRRPLALRTEQPLISFSFDDFPRTALLGGGAILNRFGVAGTYYVSLGLRGQEAPSGAMFEADDLAATLEQGHELGCHTFSHCHSWDTETDAYERSIVENRHALTALLPAARFQTFAYPVSPPRPGTKARIAKHFLCCRGGGQKLNAGTTDLNHLSAFFLEKSQDRIETVKSIIDLNRQQRGWLIFGTHGVTDDPTPYGCTMRFFEDVVKYAVESGARVLPVAKAAETLGVSSRGQDGRP